jgi:signal transduction histidine kinase
VTFEVTQTLTTPTISSAANASTPDNPDAKIEAYRRRVEEFGRVILAYSETQERLQQSHDTLAERVAELTEELGEKNRQLERRNRLAALGEMAAGIAHEIRNPLGAIKLYASLLKTDVIDRPAAAQTVDKIANGVGRLESIVSQVLYFTREIRANPIQCDLAELIHETADVARARKAESKVRIVSAGPAALSATFDPNLLAQALLNLLINAMDACGDSGTVTVRYAAGDGNRVRIAIEDTGPGLPKDVIDKVFDPFFTTKDHGTGLGLAIVNRVAEAHDGTIEAKNVEGGGAVFELTI